MNRLEVSDLVKTFLGGKAGTITAVDGVSFNIAPNESVGLVGESGSGKSTISRLICGLTRPDTGTIRVNGRPHEEADGGVQMVFQSADEALNPAFSIARSIAVGLGRSHGGADDAVRAIAEEVGLPLDLLTRRPYQLSGGQQARAGIARALISRPDLLVLDEPTAALDVSVQALVLRLLYQIRLDHGCSMLLVSHDLDVVRLMCDRILVIYHGRIVEEGPTDRITEDPRHPYTQALLSAMLGKSRDAAPRIADRPSDLRQDACHFRASCQLATEACSLKRPVLKAISGDHRVACHAAETETLSESEACSPR